MKNQDFFDEIKQGISEERKAFIMRTAIKCLIVAGLISILVVGIFVWHKNRTNRFIYKESEQFFGLEVRDEKRIDSDNAKPKSEEELFESRITQLKQLFEDGSSIYSAYAGFLLANLAVEESNVNKALYYYDKIITNKKYDQSIRDYALLIYVNLKANNNESHSLSEIVKQISEYKDSNGAIFFGSVIRFAEATFLFDMKHYDRALQVLKQITKPNEKKGEEEGGKESDITSLLYGQKISPMVDWAEKSTKLIDSVR